METAPYVEANLERAVTVRELADVAELRTHHFLRMFKKSPSLTPHQYLLERRVERSKDLLRSKRAGLAEVTLCTGLGSQSHFTVFSVVQSLRLRPNSRDWKQRQSDRQRSVAVASHILRILDPAFPHYGFISILQKDPESKSVRDEQ